MAVLVSGRGVEVVGLALMVTVGVLVAAEGRNAATELAAEMNINSTFETAAIVPSNATLEEDLLMMIADPVRKQAVRFAAVGLRDDRQSEQSRRSESGAILKNFTVPGADFQIKPFIESQGKPLFSLVFKRQGRERRQDLLGVNEAIFLH